MPHSGAAGGPSSAHLGEGPGLGVRVGSEGLQLKGGDQVVDDLSWSVGFQARAGGRVLSGVPEDDVKGPLPGVVGAEGHHGPVVPCLGDQEGDLK